MPSLTDPQIRLLNEMVNLYSPTGQESEIAEFLVKEMRSLGLRSRLDEVGNAVGKYERSGPTILLCGHMDTVPGRLRVRIEGSKLYGRGAVDAKPALAAMICAAGALVNNDIPANLLVVGAVDEEGRSRGIKSLVDRNVQADYAVFGEPSGVDNITIAYKGSLLVRLTCRTKTGHSSAPWLFRNAVEEAFDLWQELKKIRFDEEKPESKFYSLTAALTEIRGGGPISTVPSECEILVNFRLPPAISTERLRREVSKATDGFCSSRSDVTVDTRVIDSCEGYEADRKSTLVRGLSWALRDVRGNPPTLLRKTGTGDMNVLGATLRIPMVTYGAGDSRLDHTDGEYVELSDYLDSIKILQKGLTRTLELRNRTNMIETSRG